jgi:tripartite-type tricarboxylate transporter receptor subunit TctC
MKRNISRLGIAGILAIGFAAPVLAQGNTYPTKPITLVVGFTPGGISDVLARGLAQRLSSQMGQPVIVENKPGAATTIASAYVANSAPDGYTLLFQDMTSHAINVSAYKHLRYDSIKDFSMVSLVASTPLMLVVNPSYKVTDVKGLVALAKAKSDQLAYASSGNGAITHLAGETFKSVTGTNALHVPYKGGSPATQGVMGNEVAYTFSSMPPALSQVRGGKLHALAVTSPKRVSAAPDVPTLREAGVPMDIVLYNGIIGPKGLPPAIVDRLGVEIKKAINSPEMKQVLVNMGADPLTSSPAELVALMRSESEKMAKAVHAANVVLD